MRSKLFQMFFVFLTGLILFTVGLSSQEIISFESRFYVFSLEMWRHGLSLFPTTYHLPYPDYPATAIWLIYLFSKSIGILNKFSAVFPSACASAMTLVVTYLIGESYKKKLGCYAVLFLLFTYTFFEEARTISLDQFITLITALCFYLIDKKELSKRSSYWIYFLFVLGFAFRGPIGLIIPAGVVCVFYLINKNYKQFLKMGFMAFLLLIFCSLILLFLAYLQGGIFFLKKVMEMQVIGRLQEDAQTPPFYFYFTESIGAYAITFPLAILVSLGIKKIDTIDQKNIVKLLSWGLVILVGLSFPADKKIRYILPAAPAFALICSFLFTFSKKHIYFYWLRRSFIYFCLFLPLLCLISFFWFYHFNSHFSFSYKLPVFFFLLLQVALLFLYRFELIVFIGAVVTFVFLVIGVIEPINLALNKTKTFVNQVETIRQKEKLPLIFFNEGRDGLVIKYLAQINEEVSPQFINELSALHSHAMIIATEENFQKISDKKHLQILLRGNIGREPVVIFQTR